MKNIVLAIFAFIGFVGTTFGQVPQGFNYQAVVRDNSGNPVANRNVLFRVSILDSNPNGIIQFSEIHNIITNQSGLATLTIGLGTVVQGSFLNVNWQTGNKFLRIELDLNRTGIYSLLGTQQLFSVPYALFSGTAERVRTSVSSDTAQLQRLSLYGNILYLSKGGGQVTLPSSYWTLNNNRDIYTDYNVGISTNTPLEKLHIKNGSLLVDKFLKIEDADANAHINTFERLNDQPMLYNRYFFGQYGNLIIQGKTIPYNSHIIFATSPSTASDPVMRMAIMNNGNIGIGDFAPATQPVAKLHIQDGDIYIQNPNNGIVMRSPNGQCWRMTVSNVGQSVFTLIPCPTFPNNPSPPKLLSLRFDGIDDYIEIPKSLFGGGQTNEVTIECWVKTDDVNQTYGLIFSKYAFWNEVKIPFSNNKLEFFYANPSPQVYQGPLNGGSLVNNAWTHIAVTLKNNICRFFKDGRLVSETIVQYPIRWENVQGECTIGAGELSRVFKYFKGNMHKFRISKISRYTGDFAPPQDFALDSSTELLYRFDARTTSTIKDYSSNGNDGILRGNPNWVEE